jgi:hypothetical protein
VSESGPTQPRRKGTCRLFDKDFNLLATWPSDGKLYFVEDSEDGRRSGIITEIKFAASTETTESAPRP